MSQHCRANPCCGDRPCSGIPLPQDASGFPSYNKNVPVAQPAPANHLVAFLPDKTITDLAWKHFGESVFILLTREKSPPMIPQETYDVPTLALRQFVDACVSAALSTATEGSGDA